MDPRGTGKSAPLTCDKDLPDDLTSAAARDTLSACAETLGDRPKTITTEFNARDLDAVRAALGYTSIDIYAASYGTRVAFAVLKHFPGRVRALVLDGVTPPEVAIGVDQLVSAEQALHALWQRCAASTLCTDRYHDLKASFIHVKQALPRRVTIRDPRSGVTSDVDLTRRRYEDTVRSALYQSELVAIVPKVVDAAAHGDYSQIAALAELQRASFSEAVSPLVYYSVACHEDVPFLPLPTKSPLPQTSLDFFDPHVAEMRQLCALWPVAMASHDIKTPVTSDAPALLISGENDPVTPPSTAELASQSLPNARRITLAEQGHIGVFRACMPRLVADFFDQGSAKDLDITCAESAKALPLFTGANGP